MVLDEVAEGSVLNSAVYGSMPTDATPPAPKTKPGACTLYLPANASITGPRDSCYNPCGSSGLPDACAGSDGVCCWRNLKRPLTCYALFEHKDGKNQSTAHTCCIPPLLFTPNCHTPPPLCIAMAAAGGRQPLLDLTCIT